MKEKLVKIRQGLLLIQTYFYVLEGYYEQTREQVVEKLAPLLKLKELHLPDKELVIAALSFYLEQRVDFEDAHLYAQILKANQSQLYTFDRKHFKRFTELKLLP